MAKVMIIDDDVVMCEMLSSMVSRTGHEPSSAHTLKEGMRKISSDGYDIVFLDIRLPDGSGLDILPKIREISSPPPEVIIMTGYGDPDGAELAIKNGAWDYIEKPSSIKEMMLPFLRALQYREEKKARKPAVALKWEGIIGSSTRMKQCFDILAQAANSDASVLIMGETGTGKELFARAIHENSPRAHRNFVVVDCTALPKTLVESTLFGYEKGAFTGADKDQDGLVRQAHGGTLFLDEVGELPLVIQKAFLRVLQEHCFRPVGSKKELESDFRLVAATNRNLEEMAEAHHFRRDLLFRLQTFVMDLPPLRERKEDIRELVMYHIAKLSARYGIGTKGFAPDFLDSLIAYDWPGNVRELVNAVERALTMARQEPTLFAKHLPTHIRVSLARAAVTKEQPAPVPKEDAPAPLPPLKGFRDSALQEAERQYLEDLMSIAGSNIKEACRISGVSRPRLYALMKKYRITRYG
jgi:two-component system, NtrC family, response regulator